MEVICAQLNGLEMEFKLQTSEGLEVLNVVFSTKKSLLAVEKFLVSQQKTVRSPKMDSRHHRAG